MKSLIDYVNENVSRGTLRNLKSGDIVYLSKFGTDDAYKVTVEEQFAMKGKICIKFKDNKTGLRLAFIQDNKKMWKDSDSMAIGFFDDNSQLWYIGSTIEDVTDSQLDVNKGEIKKLEAARKDAMSKIERIDKEIAELTEKASKFKLNEK